MDGGALSPRAVLRDYRDLVAWQEAMRLARACHLLARGLPIWERYALASQIRRAATSVPANIAEGNGRFSRADYLRHLSIANGSLRELETLLLLARDFEYLRDEHLSSAMTHAQSVGQLIVRLSQSLRATLGAARSVRQGL